jgi:hypothetical protein
MRAVIFFMLFPFFGPAQIDSRGLGMGDCGIATATQNQQLAYNVAKTAFIQNFHQVAVNYSPWLSSISNDMRFMNASYLGNVFNTSALGVSLNYLDLGTLTTRDNNGASLATYQAREYNLTTSYALQLNSRASLGAAIRFHGQNEYTDVPKNGYGVNGDFGYYQFLNIGGDANQRIEWGAVVSNLGGNDTHPTSAGVGMGYLCSSPDEGTQVAIGVDLKKLIGPLSNAEKGSVIVSSGVEFGYLKQFFLRGGVHLESQLAGNRKFFSLGVGYQGFVGDQSWGLDFHYMVPFGTVAAISPFQNAFGFGLHISMGNFQ